MTPQVLAHRGASAAERENTISAFRRAGEMGADGVELDVRRTVDGALYVHHDPFLGDGRAMCEVTAAELPTHIPSLTAALDACAGMWVNLEIKNDPAEPDFDPGDAVAAWAVELLAARGELHRWLLSSFRLETMDRCRQLNPQIRTAWLTMIVADDAVPSLVERGHAAVHPWVGMLSRDVVEQCHAARLMVNTWTCDDPDRLRELVEWGIDGICTNAPDVARAVIDGVATASGEGASKPLAP